MATRFRKAQAWSGSVSSESVVVAMAWHPVSAYVSQEVLTFSTPSSYKSQERMTLPPPSEHAVSGRTARAAVATAVKCLAVGRRFHVRRVRLEWPC